MDDSSVDAQLPPADAPNAKQKSATLEEELENLACRFIVNLPANELASIERIGFQVELAHWFYLDFLCPQNPKLPTYNFKKFAQELLHVSSSVVPLIHLYTASGASSLNQAFSQFMQYKTRVPVCGAILLSDDWTECILVKGWGKSASWTFPKGKINQHEDQRDCALREVLEETGYDASALLPKDSKDYLEHRDNEQRCRLYIVPGVPRDTKFETQTRHEISRVEWFKLGDLPTAKKPKTPAPELGGRFYRVMPFMMRLRRWIQTNKRSHPKKPKQTAPKEKDTSLNMDELFGAQPRPVGTQKPGLIALPPEAMKQISGKAKAAAASSSRSSPAPTPAPASAQPAHNDDSRKNLLLSLLHGPQEPLPAPPQIAEQPRVDGSSALRNLLGMHQSHANTPSQPGSQQQRSLLSILQGPPKPQGQQPTPQSMPMPPMQGEWPGVLGAHGASSTPSALSAGPMSPAQTSLPNEHRAKLLPNLMASSSQPPPAVAPPMHAHPNGVHPMPVPVPPPVRSPSTAHGYPGIPLPRPMSVQSPVQHAPQSPHSAPVGVSSSQQHALLSTLLGPKPQSPAQTHAVSPHAQAQPSNLVSSPPPPQPGAQNTMNLLNILNGPAPPKQNTPPSTSALNAQNASNSLLNTLLHGKGA